MVEFCLGYDVVNTTFFEKEHVKTLDCLNKEWNNYSMDYAFANCYNLYSIKNLNMDVTSMRGTFSHCYSMEQFPEIPNSVTDISECFGYCNSISYVTNIPNSVKNMSKTFDSCINLEGIENIPNNIINMQGTFINCINLNGDIIINSMNITNAMNCFDGTSLNKDVYIFFTYQNGQNTATYNAFTNAGYNSEYRVNGALLIDNVNLYDIDLSEYEYYIDEYRIAHLTKYIGTNVNVIQPKVE